MINIRDLNDKHIDILVIYKTSEAIHLHGNY